MRSPGGALRKLFLGAFRDRRALVAIRVGGSIQSGTRARARWIANRAKDINPAPARRFVAGTVSGDSRSGRESVLDDPTLVILSSGVSAR
jgi:hypothetical protein